jgi:hypothetical protein
MQNLCAGTKIKVISIAKYNLRFNIIAQFACVYSLDSTNGAYGHENRGQNFAMICRDSARTGGSAAWSGFQFIFHFLVLQFRFAAAKVNVTAKLMIFSRRRKDFVNELFLKKN